MNSSQSSTGQLVKIYKFRLQDINKKLKIYFKDLVSDKNTVIYCRGKKYKLPSIEVFLHFNKINNLQLLTIYLSLHFKS